MFLPVEHLMWKLFHVFFPDCVFFPQKKTEPVPGTLGQRTASLVAVLVWHGFLPMSGATRRWWHFVGFRVVFDVLVDGFVDFFTLLILLCYTVSKLKRL